jgi:hypothetical protein
VIANNAIGEKNRGKPIKMFNSKVDHPGADSLWDSSRSWILAGLACKEENCYSTVPTFDENEL